MGCHTCQDHTPFPRRAKEMRVEQIASLAEANRVLAECWCRLWNERFHGCARRPCNATIHCRQMWTWMHCGRRSRPAIRLGEIASLGLHSPRSSRWPPHQPGRVLDDHRRPTSAVECSVGRLGPTVRERSAHAGPLPESGRRNRAGDWGADRLGQEDARCRPSRRRPWLVCPTTSWRSTRPSRRSG